MSSIIQISVFMDNKHGRLSTITGALAQANINIFGFCVVDSEDFGIIRLVVDDTKKAVDALHKAQLAVSSTPVLLVEVKDMPGGAKDVFDIFAKREICIDYSYGVRSAVIAFGIEDVDTAAKILMEEDIKLLSLDDLKKIQ